MGRISDKIKVVDPDDLEYKQALWKLLIAYGGVLELRTLTPTPPYLDSFGSYTEAVLDRENWSYYGGVTQDISLSKTKELWEALNAGTAQIDWDKTKVPETGQGDEFAGTEASQSLTVEFIVGLLVLTDGNECLMWTKTSDVEFGHLVRAVVAKNVTMDDAIADLGERIDMNIMYESSFPYSCRLRGY